jgi:HpcH/HpaI aldolase/citrate lyase family
MAREYLAALADVLDRDLAGVDAALAADHGDGGRQPVHTVYVPADRFGERTAAEWGAAAVEALDRHGDRLAAEVDGVDGAILARVREKLEREPVEDLRVDFEDGYGARPDADEDAAAVAAGRALATAAKSGAAPPFTGIRFKCLEAATRRRGLRTLDLVLGTLVDHGGLPAGFVVTLPKVSAVEQVTAMVKVTEVLEDAHGLASGSLRFEIQVETPQAVLGPDGTALVARMVHAAGGRCTGLHYGTYDYSAALGIAAEHQSMAHPAADHAKAVMQLAVAGTGVRLSDGSTNVLPTGDADAVLAAWRLHAGLVRRSLERGFYQGWDMHPAQLVTRYAAVFAFFRGASAGAAARLRAYRERSGSGFLDEPATAAAMAGFLLRGLDCGALDAAEVVDASGADRAALAALTRRA